MSANHTPGPWKDGPVFMTGRRAIFFNDDSKPGRWQRRLDRDKDGTFSEEDARLIAAAPDLLEALQDLLCAYGNVKPEYATEDDACRMARAAIAKATGSAA